MKRAIGVALGEAGKRIGTLLYEAQGARQSAAFTYDSSWLADAGRFAIEPTLPLVAGPQFHRRLGSGSLFHGAIADTEPDGWGRRVIMRDHVKRRSEPGRRSDAPLTDLDFLLAVDDRCRGGALRFLDEAGVFQRAAESGRRTAPPLIELGRLVAASRAVENHNETAANLAYLRGRGTSLGGLRPKCSVLDEDGALAIGKFPSVADERAVTKGEVLAMGLARAAGIDAAPARLVSSDGVAVALIRRFDRATGGARVMFISAATMLGVDADDPREHAYTELVDALRVHGAEAQRDIDELWRRIAFSILISNVDDHLRNHGFLHVAHGQWRLSPAFDLNPFPERVRELKTWISEETGPAASIEALRSVAPYFRLSAKRARQILREVERAVAAWRAAAVALGMSAIEIEQYAEAFEHPERDAARR
ncbi:MAG: type II toxin-antitoxin system HipA family toxin [Planctomycetes bacterium]|nr:type II toxin-antitoxin system HipA family toxin [Planctomycetota bacterium]